MEILVLGDSRFVFTVLNAVSSVSSGIYGGLGALGAMLGLVLMLFRGIMNKGQPLLDLTPLLISIVLFTVMFGVRVDRVIVAEVMPRAGDVNPRTHVVDNVPFGLAAAGYFVSNVGLKLTGLYDTVMGRPDDDERLLSGGLGRNLMILSQIRTMVSDPRFSEGAAGASVDGPFAYFRKNMVQFMQDCTLPPINTGHVSGGTVLQRPLEDGLLSYRFHSSIRHTVWHDTDGQSLVDCTTASAQLLAAKNNPSLSESFDRAASDSNASFHSADVARTFGRVSTTDGVAVQEIIAGHMASTLAAEAMMRGAMSPSDRQAIVMVEEANKKRTTQWVAEEDLFYRLLGPIVGFFEALFYALGPIMAFVITLGAAGWGLIVKYMMLTIWVALWFPMLSIAQLYSSIRMEDYFDRLGNIGSFTPMQLHLIANEAQSALGATSALIAATPALAMSLIYGGAVSMSFLAGRLQHSDVVDEGKMTPLASTVAPVHQTGAMTTGDFGSGASVSGMSKLTMTSSSDLSRIAESAESRRDSATAALSQDYYRSVENGFSVGSSGSTFGSSKESLQSANGMSNALSDTSNMTVSEREGASAFRSLDEGTRSRILQADAYAKANNVSLAVGMSKFGAGIGIGSSETSTSTNATEQARDSGYQKGMQNAESIEKALAVGHSRDSSISSSVQNAAAVEVGHQVSQEGSQMMRSADGERLSRSYSTQQAAESSFRTASSAKESAGLSTQVDLNTFAESMRRDGGFATVGADAYKLVDQAGGEAAAARESYQSQIEQSNTGSNAQERAQLASAMVLFQREDLIPEGMRDEAQSVRSAALGYTTIGGNAPSAVDAGSASGVGSGAASAAGHASSAAGLSGAGVSHESVRSGATSRIGGASAAVASQGDSIRGEHDGAGLASGGFNDPGSGFNSGKAALEQEYRDNYGGHKAGDGWNTYDSAMDREASGLVEQSSSIPGRSVSLDERMPESGAGYLKATVGGLPSETEVLAGRVDWQTEKAGYLRTHGRYDEAAAIEGHRDETIAQMHETAQREFFTFGGNTPGIDAARQSLLSAGFSQDSSTFQQFNGNSKTGGR